MEGEPLKPQSAIVGSAASASLTSAWAFGALSLSSGVGSMLRSAMSNCAVSSGMSLLRSGPPGAEVALCIQLTTDG